MEVTFLREEDIWGDRALEVIQAYGTKVGISDVAIALGTCMGSGTKNSAGVASGVAWSASSCSSVEASAPSTATATRTAITLANEKPPGVPLCRSQQHL